jgi:DNA replication protein DnaC
MSKSIIDQFVTISDKEFQNAIKFNPDIREDLESLGSEEVKERLRHGKIRRLHGLWIKICPEMYDETDMSRISINKARSVLAGFDLSGGLYIHGVAGSCKTRCAWYLMAREFCLGKTIACLDGFELPMIMRMDFEAQRERIDEICECDVLLIDDIFKARLTEPQETLLFEILERRTSHKLPFVITAQIRLDKEVAKLFTDNGGELRFTPISRRIQETCAMIPFG